MSFLTQANGVARVPVLIRLSVERRRFVQIMRASESRCCASPRPGIRVVAIPDARINGKPRLDGLPSKRSSLSRCYPVAAHYAIARQRGIDLCVRPIHGDPKGEGL
jgi:hypothetical protein